MDSEIKGVDLKERKSIIDNTINRLEETKEDVRRVRFNLQDLKDRLENLMINSLGMLSNSKLPQSESLKLEPKEPYNDNTLSFLIPIEELNISIKLSILDIIENIEELNKKFTEIENAYYRKH